MHYLNTWRGASFIVCRHEEQDVLAVYAGMVVSDQIAGRTSRPAGARAGGIAQPTSSATCPGIASRPLVRDAGAQST